MTKGIFITGTDTEVGKTVVTAGILRYLRNQGVGAASMKPVQTGALPSDSGLYAPDLRFHHDVAGFVAEDEDLALMSPYLYEPACSPHLAGRMAGRYPNTDHIVDNAGKLLDRNDFLLVEGAGGVHAPINETETMLDLMKALGFPVILVAHRGLGTINHSLLSINALHGAGLEVVGVVFNEIIDIPPDFIKKDNPRTVYIFSQTHILGDVDYLRDIGMHPARAWQNFEDCMPGLPKILALAKPS